jgi:hypothetical protein
MAKQFPHVSGKYGAPCGRRESPLSDMPRSVRVFRIRLDSGGYDDGGAYWGKGLNLYCAQCTHGGQQFARGYSRRDAVRVLNIPHENLIRGI